MFDVLMFIFESIILKSKSQKVAGNDMIKTLIDADFDEQQIEQALAWYAGLSGQPETTVTTANWNRIFNEQETAYLGLESCDFLLSMRRLGVLDSLALEVVVDRAFALEHTALQLAHIKWIALVVLFHQGKQEAAIKWLEQDAFTGQEEAVH